MGILLIVMGLIVFSVGLYWYVLDSIGGGIKWNMSQTHYKKEFCHGLYGKSQWFKLVF